MRRETLGSLGDPSPRAQMPPAPPPAQGQMEAQPSALTAAWLWRPGHLPREIHRSRRPRPQRGGSGSSSPLRKGRRRLVAGGGGPGASRQPGLRSFACGRELSAGPGGGPSAGPRADGAAEAAARRRGQGAVRSPLGPRVPPGHELAGALEEFIDPVELLSDLRWPRRLGCQAFLGLSRRSSPHYPPRSHCPCHPTGPTRRRSAAGGGGWVLRPEGKGQGGVAGGCGAGESKIPPGTVPVAVQVLLPPRPHPHPPPPRPHPQLSLGCPGLEQLLFLQQDFLQDVCRE